MSPPFSFILPLEVSLTLDLIVALESVCSKISISACCSSCEGEFIKSNLLTINKAGKGHPFFKQQMLSILSFH